MPFTAAAIKGLLEVRLGPEVNAMSAPLLAREQGVNVFESRTEARTYKNVLSVEVKSRDKAFSMEGTVTEENKKRIVRVDGYEIDFVPEGWVLLFSNHDRPGVIGKIGTLLGNYDVNIANFALGRKTEAAWPLPPYSWIAASQKISWTRYKKMQIYCGRT